MGVKMKNYELINVLKSLGELSQYELSIKLGYNISRNMQKIEAELKTFVDMEKTLVHKYGVKDETDNIKLDDNGQPMIYPTNRSEFRKGQTELLNLETEVELLKINLSEFGDKHIKSSLLFSLDTIIVNDIAQEGK